MIQPLQSFASLLADVATHRDRPGTVNLWWLGQSGYMLEGESALFVLDPYLSDSLTRKYAGTEKPHVRMSSMVIDPQMLALMEPVAVTSTHAHTDHLDPDTLQPLVADVPGLKLIVPTSIAPLAAERSKLPLTQILTLDAGQRVTVGPAEFIAVPASHPDLARDAKGRHLYLGYVIRLGGFTVYHSGDTLLYPGMEDLLRPFGIDLAILPINGKVGNMNGRDAASLAHAIGAKRVVPCHYDLFEFNTADPQTDFVPACQRLGQPFTVLRLGERLTLSSKGVL